MITDVNRVRRARESIQLMELLKAGIRDAQPRSVEEVVQLIDGVIAEARLVAERGAFHGRRTGV